MLTLLNFNRKQNENETQKRWSSKIFVPIKVSTIPPPNSAFPFKYWPPFLPIRTPDTQRTNVMRPIMRMARKTEISRLDFNPE